MHAYGKKKGWGVASAVAGLFHTGFQNQSMQHIIVFFYATENSPFPPPIIRTVFPETIRGKVIWKRSLHVDFFIMVWPLSACSERNDILLNISVAKSIMNSHQKLRLLVTS